MSEPVLTMPQKQAEVRKPDMCPPPHKRAGKVGVVVIGRNEGERLKRCLSSLRQQTSNTIIYVDSGSTDDSVDFAQSLDCHTVDLKPAISFSMALARNTGFRELREVMPDVGYVQFVDGDCELEPGWIRKAAAHLDKYDATTVVCGFRRERHPHGSVYNYLVDMEWQGPTGEIAACGGDAMYRVDSFESVQGFNEQMIAGEEPELCVRLRQAGGKIWRLDQPMTMHDAALNRFSQWWTRARRGGYAYAHGYYLHGSSPEMHNRRQFVSALFYGVAVPVFWLLSHLLALIYACLTIAIFGTTVTLLIILKPAVCAFRYRRKVGNSTADAGLYAFFCVLGKLPEALGILKFTLDHYTGRKSTLIEYKAPVK